MTRRGRGRPKFEPTDEQRAEVLELATKGVPHETIAKLIGVGEKAIPEHFQKEVSLGKARCSTEYIKTLYELANVDKIPSAVFFYLKTKEGFRETDRPQEEQKPVTINLKRGDTRVSKTINQSKEENGTE